MPDFSGKIRHQNRVLQASEVSSVKASAPIKIAQPDQNVPSHNLPFAPDRRPMWSCNAYGGVRNSDRYPDENKWGCNPAWRGPEGPDWLINSHIKPAQEVACDRVFVNRPAGGSGVSAVSFASWHAIPDYKRAAILEKVTDYILDEAPRPLDLCYYIGVQLADFRTLYPYSEKNPEYTLDDWKFDSSDEYSRMAMRASIGGLMAGGCTTIGLDAASTWGDVAVRFAHEVAQAPFRMRSIGEAVPVVKDENGNSIRGDDGFYIPNMDLINRMPYLALHRFYASRFNPKWSVDINKTELYIWLHADGWNQANETERESMLKGYMDRGFIPIVHGQQWAEMAVAYGEKLGWY